MIIIHIGPPKTGSTTLQTLFLQLEETGEIQYPKTGRCCNFSPYVYIDTSGFKKKINHPMKNHLGLFLALRGKLLHPNKNDLLNTFSDEIRFTQNKPIILSHEGFSFFNDNNISVFLKYFPKIKIKILIYIRNPINRIISDYRQKLRYQEISSNFQEFLQVKRPTILFEEKIIERWGKHIGHENIIIKSFDSIIKTGALEDDFLDTINLTDYTNYASSYSNKKLDDNSLKAIKILTQIRNQYSKSHTVYFLTNKFRHIIDRYSIVQKCLQLLNPISPKPLVTQEGYALLCKKTKAEYETLSEKSKSIYSEFNLDLLP